MKIHHITRLLSVGLVGAVVAIGAVLTWPVWLWFLLPALIAGALLLDMCVPRSETGRTGNRAESEDDAPEPPVEPPYEETSVVVVPVESAVADCPFLFSATIWWRAVGGGSENTTLTHGNPPALAATSVLQRVRWTTSAEHPNRCTFLEHELEGALGIPVPDDTGLVTAYATDVRLVLRQRDREHLEELDGLRKAMGTWESRRTHERNLREYLGEDVLRSPGSAVVWWMARHDEEIERAVEMIAPLTVLSAAANDEEIPEEYRDLFRARTDAATEDPSGGFEHPEPMDGDRWETGNGGPQEQEPSAGTHMAGLLGSLGVSEDSPEWAAAVYRLAQMADKAGQSEVAEDFRARLRRSRRTAEQAPVDAFEDEVKDPAETPDGTYPPTRQTAHRADEVPAPRSAWRVNSEGTVSEADEPLWSGAQDQGGDGTTPDHDGGMR
ncbi:MULTISPECIES: hypothetical protein [unclassified Streptomyces]|uniref:hypothetical protein n=1 Tax=unclassified Streptomyces TaxID=2593676 RepID=UPI0004BC2174|nr:MULTISPECIES: hypothetical protein [unclassified Streptomyces]MYY17719.1 hypothetical protein [Streptomyces sp. SID4912]SCE34804.1 hypothetical protein GA0115241_11383 [Streptomyces sp. DpondAA-D4]